MQELKNYGINLLKKKDEESLKTIGLYFNHRDTFSLEDYFSKDFINKYNINGTNYRVLGAIKFDIDFSNYDEYKRTKKDILDSISNACSKVGFLRFILYPVSIEPSDIR